MLIQITHKDSLSAVFASTRGNTTLEGLDTLCKLYDHMLHLQEEQGYVYDNPYTVVEAVWDYNDCHEGAARCWDVSYEPNIMRELTTISSHSVTTPRQVGSITFTLNQHNKISQPGTVFSVSGMFHEDFHFNGPAEEWGGYWEEPGILSGVLIDELDELNYEALKHLQDKICRQPDSVMWVYDYEGGTYQSTRPQNTRTINKENGHHEQKIRPQNH